MVKDQQPVKNNNNTNYSFSKYKIVGRKKVERRKIEGRYIQGTFKVHPKYIQAGRYGEEFIRVAKEFIIENSQFIIAEDLWRTITIRIILLVNTK